SHPRGGRGGAHQGRRVPERGTPVRADEQERDLRRVPDAAGVRAAQLAPHHPSEATMSVMKSLPTAEELRRQWRESPRWRGIERGYDAADVVRLRGTIPVEHSIARLTAEKLWRYLQEKPFVNALGAPTGNQAMRQVKAGLDAGCLSGGQVAGDATLAGEMYPDQSLYPADSVPAVVRRINNTLRRADEICHAEGDDSIEWLKPIVADAEAGFGGVLNAFEL